MTSDVAWMGKLEEEPPTAPVIEEAIAETIEPVPEYEPLRGEFHPVGDRIACKPLPLPERTAGGLFKPAHTKQRPYMARVLGVGAGAVSPTGARYPIDVATGDVVFYSQHAGITIEVNEEDVLVLRMDEVLGVLREAHALPEETLP